jgi:hypothetical protein
MPAPDSHLLLWILGFTLVGAFLSMAAGVAYLLLPAHWREKTVAHLISLATGTLLADGGVLASSIIKTIDDYGASPSNSAAANFTAIQAAIDATAAGYSTASVSRRVVAGSTVWGSLALTKGGPSSGEVVAQCKPTGPKLPHIPPGRAEPTNFLHGEFTTTNQPTLEFTGNGDPTSSYIVRLIPGTKGAAPIEFKDGPGARHTLKVPKALASGGYSWTVLGFWPDCTVSDPETWGFFIVP